MRKRNVPYKVYGGQSFYQRKEIKDVLAYFRLLCNPNDEEAFKRVINYPKRGIGGTTVERLAAAATRDATSIWGVASDLRQHETGLSPSAAVKVGSFVSLIEELRTYSLQDGVSAMDVADRVLAASGIKRELSQSTDIEDVSKRENIEELCNAIAAYCSEQLEESGRIVTIYDYITEISLLTDIEENKGEDAGKKVNLMTIHAAKGLEFGDVFIVGMEEGLFPYVMDFESPPHIEEERRLCYVAITRAKRRCCLSYAVTRMRFGKTEFCRPSRFITDIDPSFLQQAAKGAAASDAKPKIIASKPTYRRMQTPAASDPVERTSSPEYGISVGDRIRHERFGIGTVVKIENTGDSTKAHVEFENVGSKQLLLKYAKFTKVE